MSQYHLVAGMGEIGSALVKVLEQDPDNTVVGVDVDHRGKEPYWEVLHVCFPYRADFIEQVQQYLDWPHSDSHLIIVHSTVQPYTTKELGAAAVHSPIRGSHPDLVDGIKTFVKYFGGPQAGLAASIFRRLDIECVVTPLAVTTELLKLWDTTIYAINVLMEKHIYSQCRELGADFDVVYTDACRTYNEGYAALDHPEFAKYVLKHMAGPIGGHCLVPNAEMLVEGLDDPWAALVLKRGRGRNAGLH